MTLARVRHDAFPLSELRPRTVARRLPRMSAVAREALRADLRSRELMYPIVCADDGEVLDGVERVEALRELGRTTAAVVKVPGLDASGREELAWTLNFKRRALDDDKRGELVKTLREDGWAVRRIARSLSIPPATVQGLLERVQLYGSVQLNTQEKVETCDGKRYPMRRLSAEKLEERRERARSLKAIGMTHREIAEDLGVSLGTVARDLEDVEDSAPPARRLPRRCRPLAKKIAALSPDERDALFAWVRTLDNDD